MFPKRYWDYRTLPQVPPLIRLFDWLHQIDGAQFDIIRHHGTSLEYHSFTLDGLPPRISTVLARLTIHFIALPETNH